MTHVYERAVVKILDWLHLAERELVGSVVATFNGETGKVLALKLDDHHGLCFTIDPESDIRYAASSRRWYPVSTIKQVAL